ncbi:DUF3597 family protein [Arenimonas sp.]|nr:DUF3597 family protein [Candidatus Parcubacteria bacterium]
MKTTTLLTLLATLFTYFASSTHATAHHQSHCSSYNQNSIVDVMKTKDMDSSLKGRISIANKLKIPYVRNTNQNPTTKMNIALLAAINKMVTPESKTSVVDWLNLKGKDSSVKARIKLAKELRIPYVCKASICPTAKMNLNLLKSLKSHNEIHQIKKVIVVEKVQVSVTTEKKLIIEKILPTPTQQASNIIPASPKLEQGSTSDTSISVTKTKMIIPAISIQKSDNTNRAERNFTLNEVSPILPKSPAPNLTPILTKSNTDSAALSPMIVYIQTNNPPPFFQYWPYMILIVIIASLIYLSKIERKHRIQR